MRIVLLAFAALLVPIEAQAISRYNSMSMSCGEIRSTIRAEGAVILRWRSNGNPRFGRFVRGDAFCPASERAESSYVPAADRNSCRVNECKQYSPEDDDFWWLRRRRH